jgi:hypothetical protein
MEYFSTMASAWIYAKSLTTCCIKSQKKHHPYHRHPHHHHLLTSTPTLPASAFKCNGSFGNTRTIAIWNRSIRVDLHAVHVEVAGMSCVAFAVVPRLCPSFIIIPSARCVILTARKCARHVGGVDGWRHGCRWPTFRSNCKQQSVLHAVAGLFAWWRVSFLKILVHHIPLPLLRSTRLAGRL